MTLQQAIMASPYKSASHCEHGYCFFVDGSTGIGYDVSEGRDALPVTLRAHCESYTQVIPALPASLAESTLWEVENGE